MSGTEIIAGCPQMRVVHLPEPKAIGIVAILRPNRAFRPRSGQKIARGSAQYNASQAHLFAYFFWQDRKSRSAKQQSQCNCKKGSFGEIGQKGRAESPAPTGYGAERAASPERAGELERSAGIHSRNVRDDQFQVLGNFFIDLKLKSAGNGDRAAGCFIEQQQRV